MNKSGTITPKEMSWAEFSKLLEPDLASSRLTEDRRAEDPVVELTRPLSHYPERLFFYAGLIYGFCGAPPCLTERFRQEAQRDLVTWFHVVESPLVTVSGVPRFASSRVSRLLQSCPADDHQELFDFISNQVLVDRIRQRVWRIETRVCRIPDPIARSSGLAHELIIFYPRTSSVEYLPIPSSGMLLCTPEVQMLQRPDPVFAQETDKYLSKET